MFAMPVDPPLPQRRLLRHDAVSIGIPFAVRFGRLDERSVAQPHQQTEHRHADHELMLPTRGVYQCRLNGRRVEVPAGGAVLVSPGDRHQDDTPSPVAFRAICFSLLPSPTPDCSAPLLAADAHLGVRVLARATSLHELAQRLADSDRDGGQAASLLQDAICSELVARLVGLLPVTALIPELAKRIAQAGFSSALVALFDRHPHGRLDVPAMASALGLGERAFHVRCQRELGSSPAKLYLRFRLGLAREELRVLGSSVATVAERLGFATPSHFSVAYRRCFGAAPRADRMQE
jgi:AraC-like DNA-binding protein